MRENWSWLGSRCAHVEKSVPGSLNRGDLDLSWKDKSHSVEDRGLQAGVLNQGRLAPEGPWSPETFDGYSLGRKKNYCCHQMAAAHSWRNMSPPRTQRTTIQAPCQQYPDSEIQPCSLEVVSYVASWWLCDLCMFISLYVFMCVFGYVSMYACPCRGQGTGC